MVNAAKQIRGKQITVKHITEKQITVKEVMGKGRGRLDLLMVL